jgi:hypothetical protein
MRPGLRPFISNAAAIAVFRLNVGKEKSDVGGEVEGQVQRKWTREFAGVTGVGA